MSYDADIAITTIPLNQLQPAPDNPRTTSAGEIAAAELKASIKAEGLLSSLVVVKDPEDDDSEVHFVLAGIRRLQALMALAGEGFIAGDAPIACRVVNGQDARVDEISLAENICRVAMHPVDQVVAFGKLAKEGSSIAEIAARFGYSERSVMQRIKLGNDVIPEVLQDYRNGEIDMEAVHAFALAKSKKQQKEIRRQVRGAEAYSWHRRASHIRNLIVDSKIKASNRIAVFVGLDAYEKAGGKVMRDLFTAEDNSDGVFLESTSLLEKLTAKKLDDVAKTLEGWKWIDCTTEELTWNAFDAYAEIKPETEGAYTPAEKNELARIEKRLNEFDDMEPEVYHQRYKEKNALQTRANEIDTLRNSRHVFLASEMVHAGCLIHIDEDGTLRIAKGLVKSEDRNNIPRLKAATRSSSGTRTGSGVGGGNPSKAALKAAGMTGSLAETLRFTRSGLVKAHIAKDFDAAFDLALYQMAVTTFGRKPGSVWDSDFYNNALDLEIKRTQDRPVGIKRPVGPGEAMLEEHESSLELDWLKKKKGKFEAFSELSQTDKKDIFAACVARSIKGQLSVEHRPLAEFEATTARLGIAFHAEVRPTAENYWSHIPKAKALAIAGEVLGASWAKAHKSDKKDVLAAALKDAFAIPADGSIPAGVDPNVWENVKAWSIPGFNPPAKR